MPFLRVIRDKRGYETTYLMDWYQESGRQRSRVLYAFRGPGGVRVGRAALEPATMHQIEALYPSIPFDWKAIFSERQVIESGPDLRRRRPRRDDAPSEAVAPPERPAPTPRPAPPVSHPAIPTALQGESPAEQVAFLNEWYPKVRQRVEHRTTDPARREALLTLAERLNTSAWDLSADLTEPLTHAAEALERLARVLTRRRRRSKRRGVPGEAGPLAGTAAGNGGPPAPEDAGGDTATEADDDPADDDQADDA